VVTRQREEARMAVMRRRALEAALARKVPRNLFSSQPRTGRFSYA
jgi:hypothetical protein